MVKNFGKRVRISINTRTQEGQDCSFEIQKVCINLVGQSMRQTSKARQRQSAHMAKNEEAVKEEILTFLLYARQLFRVPSFGARKQ